jgi:hypothetical protein
MKKGLIDTGSETASYVVLWMQNFIFVSNQGRGRKARPNVFRSLYMRRNQYVSVRGVKQAVLKNTVPLLPKNLFRCMMLLRPVSRDTREAPLNPTTRQLCQDQMMFLSCFSSMFRALGLSIVRLSSMTTCQRHCTVKEAGY